MRAILRAPAVLVLAALGLSTPLTAAAPRAQPKPRPGARLRVSATAYCHSGETQSGTETRRGIVAADPDVLPVGSVIRVERAAEQVGGIYTVLDTGPAVQGREIDIYMADCRRAIRFGRRRVLVWILRRGWNPKASVPRAATGSR